MKMSVIFGVLHMTFGVLCKATNTFYFRKFVDFWTEVVTGIVILWGLFGWMDALIIAKFFKTYDIDNCPNPRYTPDQIKMLENEQELAEPNTCQGDIDNRKTPGIINIMITTVFAFGAYDEDKHQDALIGKDERQQYSIAVGLLVTVILFIPIMLLVKPCIVLARQPSEDGKPDAMIEFQNMNDNNEESDDQINEGGANSSMTEESELMEGGQMDAEDKDGKGLVEKRKREAMSIDQQLKEMGEDDRHGETFGEAFIHQMIETIEFVLGTVSNTASYLRLWALSLAHTELADTFLKLPFAPIVFGNEKMGGTILLAIVLWPLLWSITFGVLMCMDLLECFLHTLRLHWVEFQNKFYKGDGYKFKPYSFTAILQEVLDG